jgi:hypothetical protein
LLWSDEAVEFQGKTNDIRAEREECKIGEDMSRVGGGGGA